MSTIYLLHFDKPLHHAKHYLGLADDLEARLARHTCRWGAIDGSHSRRWHHPGAVCGPGKVTEI